MDQQPIRSKPSNAHKPRIRIRIKEDGSTRYEATSDGTMVIYGVEGQLPEVYEMLATWYCGGDPNAA